ncbi:hypothetical protein AB990_00910 [Alkalihalobacillus pseudalcaliphilus]|nr:hypothetical protein AB990_00910 [Alkalihalobacillus pseudalcaliphilus]
MRKLLIVFLLLGLLLIRFDKTANNKEPININRNSDEFKYSSLVHYLKVKQFQVIELEVKESSGTASPVILDDDFSHEIDTKVDTYKVDGHLQFNYE